jgi:hypothetical protein
MTTTTYQDPEQSLAAWLSQFDGDLLLMEHLSRSNPEPIRLADDRQRCEAQSSSPGHERLCWRLAKDGTRFCRLAAHRRQGEK